MAVDTYLCGSPFWDANVTWNTDDPDLTPCFQKTALVWVPCFYLWLATPFQLVGLQVNHSQENKTRYLIPWRWKNVLNLVIIVALIILQAEKLTFTLLWEPAAFPVDYLTPAILLLTFVLLFLLCLQCKWKGNPSSGIHFIFWLLVAFGAWISMRSVAHFSHHSARTETMQSIYTALTSLALLLNCWADHSVLPASAGNNVCPQKAASYLSRATFSWFTAMAWLGWKRPVTLNDLWQLPVQERAQAIGQRFVGELRNSRERGIREEAGKDGNTGLLRVMITVHGPAFALGALLRLAETLMLFAGPVGLGWLIAFVEHKEVHWKGYLYVGFLFAVSIMNNVTLTHYYWQMYLVALRVKTSLFSAVFDKALRLTDASRKESTLGEVVNLMSVDADHVSGLLIYLHTIWAAPLQLFIILYLLWGQLGIAVLAGAGVMVAILPINWWYNDYWRRIYADLMELRDTRSKAMDEIVGAMRILKLYAWEICFERKVTSVRDKEIRLLKKSAWLSAIVGIMWNSSGFVVSLAVFGTYVATGGVLDSQKIFVSLSLLNILKIPMAMLPALFAQYVEARVSFDRISKFLGLEELPKDAVTRNPEAQDTDTMLSNNQEGTFVEDHTEDDKPLLEAESPVASSPEAQLLPCEPETAVQIQADSFSWDLDKPILHNIDLEVRRGELVAIVGQVGAGKSSLLLAALGEMRRSPGGRVSLVGSMAYVAQTAWIQNMSVRDNILFGAAYNSDRYNQVLDACCLLPDLAILPAHDLTEIGEKGVNLSGGQKQRVSLARAVYSNADLYLLDDPLSAVDVHVSRHIFERVLGPTGMLCNKTRLLVTQSSQYSAQADRVLVVRDGHVQVSDNDTIEDSGSSTEVTQLGTDNLGKVDDSKNDDDGHLVEEETVETGRVKLHVYAHYLRAMGIVRIIFTMLVYLMHELCTAGGNLWLAKWADAAPKNATSHSPGPDVNYYLEVYGAFGIGQAIAALMHISVPALGCVAASKVLHETMLSRVMRCPLSFFETTPSGRIISRFTKDVDVMDDDVPMRFIDFFWCSFEVAAILVMVSYTTPWFMVVIVPVLVPYLVIQTLYISTSRQLRRLKSKARSPLYSHFSETLHGAWTIRAYGASQRFVSQADDLIDEFQTCYFHEQIAGRWMGTWLDQAGSLVILFASFFAVMSRESISPGLVGLSISYAMQITDVFSWMIESVSEMETDVVSIERIKEYGEVPQEAPWQLPSDVPAVQNAHRDSWSGSAVMHRFPSTQNGSSPDFPIHSGVTSDLSRSTILPQDWPQAGHIQIKDYCLRYRPGLPLALEDVNLEIRAGERVGIVGRTGSGKTSLALSMFRVTEPDGGGITIDGVDISRVGLHRIRSCIAIIPQDPILFCGTLRSNLDPLEEMPDSELWKALEQAHLKEAVETKMSNGLEHEVTEGGGNLSHGQRQLLCLARALLRKTRILVLDEATASVDTETDELVQRTIREQFPGRTVLTVAHRINTVMDSDRILVMDLGMVKEFGTPQELLANNDSVFRKMAAEANLLGEDECSEDH